MSNRESLASATYSIPRSCRIRRVSWIGFYGFLGGSTSLAHTHTRRKECVRALRGLCSPKRIEVYPRRGVRAVSATVLNDLCWIGFWVAFLGMHCEMANHIQQKARS